MIPPPPGQQATTERHAAPVMAAGTWANNAELIRDAVVPLCYLRAGVER